MYMIPNNQKTCAALLFHYAINVKSILFITRYYSFTQYFLCGFPITGFLYLVNACCPLESLNIYLLNNFNITIVFYTATKLYNGDSMTEIYPGIDAI